MNDEFDDDDDDHEELMHGGNSVGNLAANRMGLVLWCIATLLIVIYIFA